jgi:threonine dehydratase
MDSALLEIPDITAISAAAARIAGEAVRTPLIRSDVVDSRLGLRVYFKPENLQRTGSFKFRGAFNALSRLDEAQRAAGIVACSSGNHAQGVAEAARLLAIDATIFVPRDAPAIKVGRARRSGARIIAYDRTTEDREALADEFERRTGAHFVHPFNDPDVIAGQGTCGLEIAEDFAELGESPDRLLVSTGGGGLAAGVAIAMHHRFPNIAIHSVEPEGFDDYRRSLLAGGRQRNTRLGESACDALLSDSPGEISFAVSRMLLSEGLTVTDEEAFDAIRYAFAELKLVLEPGGSVALAALRKHAVQWRGETVVCILSGGNVDPGLYARVLGGAG